MRNSKILTGLAAATMSAALLAPAAPAAAAPTAAPATVSAQATVGSHATASRRVCAWRVNWLAAFNGRGPYILVCFWGEEGTPRPGLL